MASSLSAVALAYYALPSVAVLLHAGVGYWIYRDHWGRRGAKWFVVTLATGGLSTFFFWLYLFVPPTAFKRAMFFPIALFAFCSYLAFPIFAGQYTETDFHRHWLVRVTMVAVLGGFVALSLTRPAGLYTANVRLIREPVTYYAYEVGAGLRVIYLLTYALGGYTVYRLFVYLLSTSARATRQLALLIAAVLSVIVVIAASQAGLFPAEELNHAAYATLLFNMFATLALFRFDLLNVQPVARNAVVENLRDPVVVLDEDRRVVDYNEASIRLWADLDGHVGDPLGVACPDLSEAVSFPEAGEETSGRFTRQFAEAERHYSVNVSQVSRGRDDRHWYSVLLRDVTALERSRWQLERQNERLDQVASTVSHDLRNHINVADGYTEILDDMIAPDGLDAEEADTADQHLDQIRTSHDRMEAIIADVLTIAREGKTVEETRSVSLATAARDAWANVDTGDATLTVDGDCQLQADRSKFLSILENLFRNALDHGPADVTVEVDVIGGGFAVADDGPGIPDEHADDIFEYGYTTTDEGTGLGLSIVKTMAESHGWTVEYDTDTQQGARFVFGNVDVDHDAGRPEVGPGQS
ncbi:ATP-binding protein [Halorientalis sp.]|uniref:sensor histidine kinase n=1 Tax=Halorientalis sp. TaxID=1931229 RepID=UPI00260ECC23|nr:ATP-binding protein [Halorientalis sp.]